MVEAFRIEMRVAWCSGQLDQRPPPVSQSVATISTTAMN
jgi:hypothetical protein